MLAYLPFILVALALFTAGCIAYVAWELSSEKAEPQAGPDSVADSIAESTDKPEP